MSSAPAQSVAGLTEARVLVTGASGFIGSRLVERLAKLGIRPAALSRSRGAVAHLVDAGACEHIVCDLLDPPAVRAAAAAVAPSVIFHFASAPDGAETPDLAQQRVRVNTLGTLHLLEAAARLDPPPALIYGDSRKVYGSTAPPHREDSLLAPTSSYGASKAAGWLHCEVFSRLYGVRCVSLRPSLIYGPGQARNIVQVAIDAAVSGAAALRLQGGSQTRDPLFIEDALDAFLLAARLAPDLDRRVVNIGGGEEVRVRDLAQTIVELAGSQTRVICEETKARPNEIWRSACDNSEAAALLGWSPRHTLREGLERTVRDALARRVSPAHAGTAS